MSKIHILTPQEVEERDRRQHGQTLTKDSDSLTTRQTGTVFERQYPNIAHFTKSIGWIEMGDADSPLTSFIRALDSGGMIWEGQDEYPSLDAAFEDLERGLGEWMDEEGL